MEIKFKTVFTNFFSILTVFIKGSIVVHDYETSLYSEVN